MCVKHAPRLNQGPLSCGPLFPMFFGRHLSIPCCSISSEDVQIDRTFSLLLETASGFELEPIPRSARYVARRATTERSAISRIVAKVLRPDCGGGGDRLDRRRPHAAPRKRAIGKGTVEFGPYFVDTGRHRIRRQRRRRISRLLCVANPSRSILQWTFSASGPLRCVTHRSAPPL